MLKNGLFLLDVQIKYSTEPQAGYTQLGWTDVPILNERIYLLADITVKFLWWGRTFKVSYLLK